MRVQNKGNSGATSTSKMASGKRELICGVSYKNQKYDLKGTINDVHQMKEFLQDQYGFPNHTIQVLAEEDEPETLSPTRQHMEEGLKWLVEGCKPGDSLLFYFSAHGQRQHDIDNEELDGYNETIYPVDFSTKGPILDNGTNAMIVRSLVKGVKLHAVIDVCHCGTSLDVQQAYNPKEGVTFPDVRGNWIDNKPLNGAKKGTSGGQAICLSACLDDQKSADTTVRSFKTTAE